jgi:hypothetical protein
LVAKNWQLGVKACLPLKSDEGIATFLRESGEGLIWSGEIPNGSKQLFGELTASVNIDCSCLEPVDLTCREGVCGHSQSMQAAEAVI